MEGGSGEFVNLVVVFIYNNNDNLVCGVGSVDVLGEPTESLTISLTLQHGAHEQLQRTAWQLAPTHLALPRGLSEEAKEVSEFVFRGGARSIDFVSEYKDRTICQLFVCKEAIELDETLLQPPAVTAVDEEYNSVHSWEIILPHLTSLGVTAQVECCESHIPY